MAVTVDHTGSGTVAADAATWIDPNFVFLLFLFGFCLLYVALLAIDTALEHLQKPRMHDEDLDS